MISLTGLIQLSKGALLADQAALNATANNVANQNTAGYTSQVVRFTSQDTVTLGAGGGSVGTPTATTTSLRDRVLEQRVQQQTQQQAGTSSEASVLNQVEAVFSITGSSDTAGSTQLGTSIDSLFSSLAALASSPSDAVTQQSAVAAASTLADAFNSAASGIQGVAASVNTSLATSVSAVNALTSTIAQLSATISSNGLTQDAGVLEDQRQSAIEQLSQLIGLDQVRTEGNGITLSTTGGAVLVSGTTAYALSSAQSGGSTAIYDHAGNEIDGSITGGSIGGQLHAQQTDLPQVTASLDALAYRIGTLVNAQNLAGQTSAGAAGGAIFNVPSTAAGAAAHLSVLSSAAFATAAIGQGSTGNSNANLLQGLSSSLDATGLTISGKLAEFLGGIGSASLALSNQSAGQQASLTQLTTQRDTLSAVNLDTEASNLTTYQRAYQASAQVLAIINTLLASAINLGTDVAVS